MFFEIKGPGRRQIKCIPAAAVAMIARPSEIFFFLNPYMKVAGIAKYSRLLS